MLFNHGGRSTFDKGPVLQFPCPVARAPLQHQRRVTRTVFLQMGDKPLVRPLRVDTLARIEPPECPPVGEEWPSRHQISRDSYGDKRLVASCLMGSCARF